MRLKYPNNTYILEDPENYNFFSVFQDEKIDEAELTLFEDVVKVIISKNPQEYYNELYIQKNLNKIKELFQALDYFAHKKTLNTHKIYHIQTQKKNQEFVEKYIEKTNNPFLNDTFIRTGMCVGYGVNWYGLCRYANLPVEFWEKHLKEIDWKGLSYNINIPVEFWEKHLNEIDWYWLSQNPNITMEFCEKYPDKIKLPYLFGSANLPAEFWEKHLDVQNLDFLPPTEVLNKDENERYKLSWYYLSRNPNIPIELCKKYPDKLHWNDLCQYANLPVEFWEKYIDTQGFDESERCKINWNYLCLNKNVSFKFWKKYLDIQRGDNGINWDGLSRTANFPVEIWEKYINMINWRHLSANSNIPVEFWEKHLNKIYWPDLSRCANLPIEFWEKHLDKIFWGELFLNNNTPIEFLDKYIDKYTRKNGGGFKEFHYRNLPVEFWNKHYDKIHWLHFNWEIYSQEEQDFYSKIEVKN